MRFRACRAKSTSRIAPPRLPVHRVPVRGAGGGEAHAVGPVEPEPPVDPADAGVVVPVLPRGGHGADVGLRIEVVAHASDERLREAPEGRVRHVVEPSRGLVVGDEHAQRHVADLPGELRPVARVDDRARVHEVDRGGRGEDLLALQEERPLLGIEEREALVHLDLRPVRLDLREVGVVGQVERQVGGDPVLDAHADLAQRVLVAEAAGVPIERADLEARERRQELQVAARRQVRQPLQHPHLGQLAGDVARDGRPDQRLGLLPDVAADLEAPPVRLAGRPRRVAQALEGDGHLRRPAVLDEAAARLEQRVPGAVAADAEPGLEAPAASAAPAAAAPAASAAPAAARAPDPAAAAGRLPAGIDDGVARHAVPVHRELVGALLVEKRVEQDRHPVVAHRLVALRPVRPDDAGVRVVRVEGDVEVVAVVGDPHLGPLGRRSAFHRARLHEVGDRLDRQPHRVVEAPVDAGRLVRPRRHRAWPFPDRESAEPGSLRRPGRGRNGHRRCRRGPVPVAGTGTTAGGVRNASGRIRAAAAGRLEREGPRDGGRRPAVHGGHSIRQRRHETVLESEEITQGPIDPGSVGDGARRHVDDFGRDVELVAEAFVCACDLHPDARTAAAVRGRPVVAVVAVAPPRGVAVAGAPVAGVPMAGVPRPGAPPPIVPVVGVPVAGVPVAGGAVFPGGGSRFPRGVPPGGGTHAATVQPRARRSVATVSAMPSPIQSSSGRRLRLRKGTTETSSVWKPAPVAAGGASGPWGAAAR